MIAADVNAQATGRRSAAAGAPLFRTRPTTTTSGAVRFSPGPNCTLRLHSVVLPAVVAIRASLRGDRALQSTCDRRPSPSGRCVPVFVSCDPLRCIIALASVVVHIAFCRFVPLDLSLAAIAFVTFRNSFSLVPHKCSQDGMLVASLTDPGVIPDFSRFRAQWSMQLVPCRINDLGCGNITYETRSHFALGS